MSEHEVVRSMPATPDEVFRVATDPRFTARWLPATVGGAALRTDAMRADAGARRIDFGAEGGLQGWLEVRPDPSGGSDVVLHAAGGDGETTRGDLANALLRLANEVAGGAR